MKALTFWRFARGASRLACAVLTPISRGAAWLASRARRLEDRCDTRLVLARARVKVAAGARQRSRA